MKVVIYYDVYKVSVVLWNGIGEDHLLKGGSENVSYRDKRRRFYSAGGSRI